jgi:hypothetical protein
MIISLTVCMKVWFIVTDTLNLSEPEILLLRKQCVCQRKTRECDRESYDIDCCVYEQGQKYEAVNDWLL